MATMQRLPENGSFVMLNLFRLRDAPDYSKHPTLAEPDADCHTLFLRYIDSMDRILARFGIERIFLGDGAPCLIGPPDERWDIVQMVRYPSRQAFMDLSSDPELRDHVPLREVTIEDSRVLPMLERALDAPASA